MGNFGGDAGGVFYDYYEEEYSDEDDNDYEAEVRQTKKPFLFVQGGIAGHGPLEF